jgi:hypothetical protein
MQPSRVERGRAKRRRVERRKEPRFRIQIGAIVEVCNNGRISRATTVDMSLSGALIEFSEPPPLQVGDRVICEFLAMHDEDKKLPYWGVGYVVRIEDHRAAISLKAGGFLPLE